MPRKARFKDKYNIEFLTDDEARALALAMLEPSHSIVVESIINLSLTIHTYSYKSAKPNGWRVTVFITKYTVGITLSRPYYSRVERYEILNVPVTQEKKR